MDPREEVNRSAAEYVARTRLRLADGQAEIDRQHASLDDTRDHMAEMERWRQEERGDAA